MEAAGNCDACEENFAAAQSAFASVLDGVTDITASRAAASMAEQPEMWESASEAPAHSSGASDSATVATMRFGLFDEAPEAGDTPAPTDAKNKRRKGAGKGPTPTLSSAPSPRTTPRSRSPPNAHPAPNKKVQDLIAKTNDVFTKHQETYSDESMWASKIRKRNVDAATKALSTLASQLLVCNHPDASELSTIVANWCDGAEKWHQCLSSLRASPLDYVDEVDVEKLVPLRMMSAPMLSNIILHVAAECLKLLDKALRSESSIIQK